MTYFTAAEETDMAREGVSLFFEGFSSIVSIDFV